MVGTGEPSSTAADELIPAEKIQVLELSSTRLAQSDNPTALTVDEFIASGSGGLVFKGQLPNFGTLIAIKTDDPRNNAFAEPGFRARKQDELKTELKILRQASESDEGACLIKCLGDVWTDETLDFICLELMDNTLRGLMDAGRLTKGDVYQCFGAGLKALKWLHAQGWAHMDIKPGQVLGRVTEGNKWDWKLADFGAAKRIDDKTWAWPYFKGTPGWMAPEAERSDFDGALADRRAIDIWVWFYSVAWVLHPFWRHYDTPSKGEKIYLRACDPGFLPDLEHFEDMASYDPSLRPSAHDLVDRFERLWPDGFKDREGAIVATKPTDYFQYPWDYLDEGFTFDEVVEMLRSSWNPPTVVVDVNNERNADSNGFGDSEDEDEHPEPDTPSTARSSPESKAWSQSYMTCSNYDLSLMNPNERQADSWQVLESQDIQRRTGDEQQSKAHTTNEVAAYLELPTVGEMGQQTGSEYRERRPFRPKSAWACTIQ